MSVVVSKLKAALLLFPRILYKVGAALLLKNYSVLGQPLSLALTISFFIPLMSVKTKICLNYALVVTVSLLLLKLLALLS